MTVASVTLPASLVAKMEAGAEEHILELERQCDEARTQRDEARKLFNRIEVSVTHHRNAKLRGVDTSDELDEALWATRDRVLSAAHSKDLASLGQIGNEADDGLHPSIDHGPKSEAEKLGELPPSQEGLDHDTCPTCGTPVLVVSGDEGTSHYSPA
jgi:hypothetical protein